MPGIARVGIDIAGGVQLPLISSVFVNGALVQVLGGPVAGHGIGPHAGPIMATASSSVFAEGIPVCKAGDSASCGHVTSGSPNVNSG